MATSEAQQQAALRVLHSLARREIADALNLVDAGDAAAVADMIVTVVPSIAERYGLAAGSLAADWYEDLREQAEAAGYFQPVIAELPDQGRYESLAAWASDRDATESLVSGGVQRIVANMHRDTVMKSAFADPQAEGWARFARGAETCGFCYMLVSRGAVYTESGVKFGAHDDCDCGAGPIWKGANGATQVDAYKKSARRREDADGNAVGGTKADQERAKEWIDAHLT